MASCKLTQPISKPTKILQNPFIYFVIKIVINDLKQTRLPNVPCPMAARVPIISFSLPPHSDQPFPKVTLSGWPLPLLVTHKFISDPLTIAPHRKPNPEH